MPGKTQHNHILDKKLSQNDKIHSISQIDEDFNVSPSQTSAYGVDKIDKSKI